VKALAGDGFDADHLARVAHPCGLAGGEAAAARCDEQGVVAVELVSELCGHGALTCHHLDVLVRVDEQRAGFVLVRIRCGLGVVVQAVDHVHGGSERLDAVALQLGAGGGHEDLGAMAEATSGVGDGSTVVASGRGDETCLGNAVLRSGGEDLVEGSADLERTGVLQQFELQRHAVGEAEFAGAGGDDRCAAHEGRHSCPRRRDHVGRDERLREGSSVRRGRGCLGSVHEPTLPLAMQPILVCSTGPDQQAPTSRDRSAGPDQQAPTNRDRTAAAR